MMTVILGLCGIALFGFGVALGRILERAAIAKLTGIETDELGIGA